MNTGQWDEILHFLGDDNAFAQYIEHIDGKILAPLCYIRAKAYDRLDNKKRARSGYILALNYDPYMVDAFDSVILLMKHSDQLSLVANMNLKEEWLQQLYLSKVNSTGSNSKELTILREKYSLGRNTEIMLRNAESCYHMQKFVQALALVKEIMKLDPFNSVATPLYINCLVEMGMKSELYNFANDLVLSDPKNPHGWYAVGCYYFSIKKNEESRKYFQKANSLDSKFVSSWVALGHTYGLTDDTDFAMNSYRTASKLCPGSHIPLMCLGIECLKTNSLQLAESNLQLSKEICNSDPILYNELGVIQYRHGQYKNAIQCFQHAIQLCPIDEDQLNTPKSLERTYYNLGHCFRKLELFDEAIQQYTHCQRISKDGSIDSAIGFTHHLKGDYQRAIEHYHKGLSQNSEDTFITELISRALLLFTSK